MKAETIAGVKEEAGRRLALTDWKITRAAEGIKPVDQATLDARAAIRARAAEIEASVLAAADNAAVRACNISFDLGAA